ncbi:MAG: Fur family transcriptional regulator [Chloroflexota bacterium]
MDATSLASEVVLRRAGLRVTDQRVVVLEILRRSGEHLDAREIYAAARAQDADVSLATVYRTVRALERAGLIEQRYFGPGHGHDHYEAAGGPEHYHFTCVKCRRVFEFEAPLVVRLQSELHRQRGWHVRRAFFMIEGECADCADHDSHGRGARG